MNGEAPGRSRVQIALNVDDLDAAVAFYTVLFGAAPAKQRPGYANFVLDDPPLKLSLLTGYGPPGLVNHLGIEFDDADGVDEVHGRLAASGIPLIGDREVLCCYSRQSKVWLDDPAGARWEVYTLVEDTDKASEGGFTAGASRLRTAAASRTPGRRLRHLAGRARRRVLRRAAV